MTFTLSTLLLFAPAAPLAPVTQGEIVIEPPGLVKIEGGPTYVGTDPSEIQEILNEAPSYKANLRPLDGETPQFRETVGAFYLARTEITNEQYAPFVQATNYRPPFEWADTEAFAAANLAWQKQEQEKFLAEKEEGRRYEKKPFDPEKWWEEAWKEHPWEVPMSLALVPVVRIAYEDALAYCRWAGLRLPSEFEFQRAVRGKSKDPWPWGDKWEKETRYAATKEIPGLNSPMPVGSFPEGATKDGIFDLIGNAWEWTSSRYMPLKGFKENEYKIGKEKVKKLAIWDANKRVTVGGSFAMDRHIARASVRAEADRKVRRNALGFRPAASLRAGEDIARVLHDNDVRQSDARPDGVSFLPEATVAMDQWLTSPSGAENAPEGYQVVQGYEYAIFVPLEKLEESQDTSFQRDSLSVPTPLGYFACSMALIEPAVEAGVYFISYRGEGKAPRVRKSDEEEEEGEEPAEAPATELENLIDFDEENFIFINAQTDEFAGSLPVGLCKFDKAEGPGSINFIDHTIWETITDEEGEEQRVQKVEKRLSLEASIASPIRNRVLKINLIMNAPQELASQSWRRE